MAGLGAVAAQAAGNSIPSTYAQQRDGTPMGTLAQGQDGYWEKRLGPAYRVELSTRTEAARGTAETDRLKRTGQIECQTCKQRRYQDVSNDPGVSFKTPGYISSANAAAVVSAHEQEHVSREQADARGEGRRVVAQSVRLFTAVCPECGRVYVSGGETRTTTAADNTQRRSAAAAAGNGVDLVA